MIDWNLIIKGSLGLVSVISIFLAGYKYRSYRQEKKERKDAIKHMEKLAQWGARNQERAKDHAKEISKISEDAATPDSVSRVLSRPVKGSKTKSSGT